MENIEKCPVCQNVHGGHSEASPISGGWGWRIDCEICGRYDITKEAYHDELKIGAAYENEWTEVRRVALSHALITQRDVPIGEAGLPVLATGILEEFRKSGRTLPTRLQQANNTIQYIGNYEYENGQRLELIELKFYARIGAISPDSASTLAYELHEIGLVGMDQVMGANGYGFEDAFLTLDGWERWEKERSNENTSNVGMIAMQFGDPILDALVNEVIKPAIEEISGLSVERIDDSPKAGIIDVILRQTIRDAAFVIADLSHANRGAYWEAGFAEGLGKPVIYICEQSVWDDQKTHFDTNHCTTVIYENDKPDEFKKRLIATIRNSLNLFS